MTFQFRRVITGHDAAGHATVKADEVVEAGERLPGYYASTVWCTTEIPVNNDEGAPQVAGPAPGSRVLMRIAEMRADQPSGQQMHRTESLDYAVILSGECDMQLDGGTTVKRLKAGDVVIQRGTNHAWRPVGDAPCRLLFVLIDAQPVHCGDITLRDNVAEAFKGAIHPQNTAQFAAVQETRK